MGSVLSHVKVIL